MKILLTGKNGQIGFELTKILNILGDTILIDREQLDLANPNAIRTFVDQVKPDVIINTAAYTKVDKAELEPELANQINAIAPEIFTEKSAQLNIPLIHFSTDYVFDGLKKEPYIESDLTNPQSIYGKTKCKGEENVRTYKKHIILRTSWVFGAHGNNFLKTILELIKGKESIEIVGDQWGKPSSASMLANVTFKIIDKIFKDKNFNDYGTYHVACEGEINWHQYAKFIAFEVAQLGLKIKCEPDRIYSISTSEYQSTAKRPLNSILSTEKLKKSFMLELPHWETEVKNVLRKIV